MTGDIATTRQRGGHVYVAVAAAVTLRPEAIAGVRDHGGGQEGAKWKEGDETKRMTHAWRQESTTVASGEHESGGSGGLFDGDDEEGHTGDKRESKR